MRLVDDAFIKICQMVNDLSMKVRAEATGLLGSLHHVSPRFLEQTLDKKVMSHLKVREEVQIMNRGNVNRESIRNYPSLILKPDILFC